MDESELEQALEAGDPERVRVRNIKLEIIPMTKIAVWKRLFGEKNPPNYSAGPDEAEFWISFA